MNGVIIEKSLCPVGEEIDRDLDNLLAKQQDDPTPQRKNEIHNLLKHYFGHRRNCFDCKVAFRFVEE
ncbi:hypothetical protein BECAL_02961 [Bellilinea caldifistulae]|uniref:Uncharacterized protein n=1 Tax=Bellilinea caldifistulae TaxID=360411 RepID=A0A0P6X103_9CHLR|nr:hypothetical protein [Bellilinea caldifistulae]KPL74556.1 hypothetical protein AC812_12230 [Bellilinea caldifistulae]GAP11768.1 hypothetical protein BECAL_02961 [Bellilinea caldifistulae]